VEGRRQSPHVPPACAARPQLREQRPHRGKLFEIGAAHGVDQARVETLFTRRNWVTVGSDIGWMLRDNRKLFLSAKTFHSFRGYSFGQLSRIRNGHVSGKSDNSTRQEFIDKYKFDIKMSYHLLRLLDELEQILTVQDIDLMRAKDVCIAMRKGEWGTFEQLEAYFNQKLATLEDIMLKGVLTLQPQVGALQKLLAECIEQYYGSMSKANVEYLSAKDVMEKLLSIEQKLDLLNRESPQIEIKDHGKVLG
jgi:hypothetical protein